MQRHNFLLSSSLTVLSHSLPRPDVKLIFSFFKHYVFKCYSWHCTSNLLCSQQFCPEVSMSIYLRCLCLSTKSFTSAIAQTACPISMKFGGQDHP